MRATGSISKLFFSKNGIPSMTSCDTNGAIFKTVGDLVLTLTDD